MNRRLLTPGWVLLHLVFVVAFAATLWLGWWQWESAQSAGGSFRNLGYALQWPLFGAFTLFLWYQVARMELYKDRAAPDDGEANPDPEPSEPPDPSGDSDGVAEEEPVRRRRRSPVPPPAPPVDADEDPELVAYNRYLAELNRADGHR